METPTEGARYIEVVITPHHGSGGMWQTFAQSDIWDSIDVLDGFIRGNVEVVPWETIEGTDGDIRGHIYNEGDLLRLYAWRLPATGSELHYSGIREYRPAAPPAIYRRKPRYQRLKAARRANAGRLPSKANKELIDIMSLHHAIESSATPQPSTPAPFAVTLTKPYGRIEAGDTVFLDMTAPNDGDTVVYRTDGWGFSITQWPADVVPVGVFAGFIHRFKPEDAARWELEAEGGKQ